MPPPHSYACVSLTSLSVLKGPGVAGGSAYAFSPEPQEEDKGQQEGHQGDAVAQVVDDDSNMVVHFALLLKQERGQR